MDYKVVGFLATCFVGMTLINRMLEGAMIAADDIAILNTMTIMTKVDVGLFSLPVPNLDFFTGLGHLVKWDYSFFGGNAQIIQYFLYVFTFVAAFIMLMIILQQAINSFGRTR